MFFFSIFLSVMYFLSRNWQQLFLLSHKLIYFFLELKSPFGTLKIKLPEIKLHDECNQETCDSK